jgi:hypothetical protein
VPIAPGTSGADDDAVPPLRQRLSRLMFKPTDPADTTPAPVAPKPSLEELEDAQRYANDKERMIGLLCAPIGALIGFLVIHADIANDPAQYLKGGATNPKYTPVSTYHELLIVLLVFCLGMLVAAWFRKRLFLGMLTALYGLAIFNLHWWGFGVPFVLVGAWYLVRAYRAQRDVREATGGTSRAGSTGAAGPAPTPSKRYTPPSARSKRRQLPES